MGQLLPQQQREIFVKVKLYRTLRLVFIFVVIAPIMIAFFQFLLLTWRTDWIFHLLNESLVALTFCYTCYLFVPSHEAGQVVNYGTSRGSSRSGSTILQSGISGLRSRSRIFSTVERINRSGSNSVRQLRHRRANGQLLGHQSDDDDHQIVSQHETAELVDTRAERDRPVLLSFN